MANKSLEYGELNIAEEIEMLFHRHSSFRNLIYLV